MTDRERYDSYVEKVNKMLASDDFYASFKKKLKAAKPVVKLNTKHRNKSFDLDWVEIIEATLPHLDNIVRNPRKHIVIEEDIVDISLARAISTESVKHLAQHTNLISSVDKDGMVTPNKILNTTKEESFEIYENRFIYTLLKNLSQFVTRRLEAIKAAYVNDHVLELNVDTSVFTGKTRVFYKLDLIASLPFDEVQKMQNEDLSVVERIAKMQRIINDFLGSAFAKQMVNSAPVRPPITRTNVILKNPDFKKALVLWQFIESYTKTGFAVENEVKKMDMDETLQQGVTDMICLNSMLMEGLVQGEVEDSAFYSESNLEEKDIVEKEEEKPQEQIKDEEKPQEPQEEQKQVEKEIEKEIQEEAIDESGAIDEQTPQDEEAEHMPDEEEKEKEQEEEEEEDEEADQYQELLTETKNVFQRTSEEATMSRAELQRINKAIDRVLLRYRLLNSEEESAEAWEAVENNELDRAKLVRKIEKEMEVVRRAIDKRIMIAERERLANERALEKERKKLAELERQLAEQKGLIDEDEDIEDEVIEDDVVGALVDEIDEQDQKDRDMEAKVDELEELLDGDDQGKLVELGKAILAKHGVEDFSPMSEEQIEQAKEESAGKGKLTADAFVKPKKQPKTQNRSTKNKKDDNDDAAPTAKAMPQIEGFTAIAVDDKPTDGELEAQQIEASKPVKLSGKAAPKYTKATAPNQTDDDDDGKPITGKAMKNKKPRAKLSDLK